MIRRWSSHVVEDSVRVQGFWMPHSSIALARCQEHRIPVDPKCVGAQCESKKVQSKCGMSATE